MVIHIKDAPLGFRKNDINQRGYIYIGRPHYYGNPIIKNYKCIVCGVIHTKNGETLSCFEKYARHRITVDLEYRKRVKELYGKILVCFCKPKQCHGDILEKLSKELNNTFENMFDREDK